MELLRKLSEAAGVPGREEEVRTIVRGALKGHVDTVEVDRLGNLIAHKKGQGPKVVVAGHMDEIGFLVSHVDEETGFLRIEPVGGFDPRTLIASRVTVHAKGGPLLGLIGTKPVHILTDEERKKEIRIQDLFVDIGLPGKRAAKAVRVGDPVTLVQSFARVGDLVSGKALDDRVGVYVGIEAVRRLKKHQADVYFVGTVQEEVGLRGARASAFAINPDIGVALDVTLACDMPGVSAHEQVTKLGKGVAIKVKDSASISHPGLVRFLVELAEEKKIPYQMEILPRGGTDAGAIQLAREGAAVVTLSVPTRYVHSVVEAAHVDDIEAAIALLAAFLDACPRADLAL
ncbi:MAG TPA: M42 family metallopeptidase [Candidatus Bipolaricaulis anaerobius]|nr:M42 family metallopeptidase [Candidatus Bipolaricaulis anaerobius]HNS24253.1 M42 family metallopeptidase [Candidatus Bipolaricaulis anaerobius]